MAFRKRHLTSALAAGLLLAGLAPPALAVELDAFVLPTVLYYQTGPATFSAANYEFRMGGEIDPTGSFTSGTMTYPGTSSPQTLTALPTRLEYNSAFYSSLSDMQSDYPFGTYTVDGTGPSGPQTSSVSYTANYFTSQIPIFTNYSSFDGLDPGMPFTFNFPAFTLPNPATDQSYIFFLLYDQATGNAIYYQPLLPATTSSWTIPANLFSPNTGYIVDVVYNNRIVFNTGAQEEYDVRTEAFFTTGMHAVGVPEPDALGLFVLGLLGLAFCCRWSSLH